MWRRLASLTTLVVTLEGEEGASMEALEETEEVEVLETMDIDPTTTEAITGDLEVGNIVKCKNEKFAAIIKKRSKFWLIGRFKIECCKLLNLT